MPAASWLHMLLDWSCLFQTQPAPQQGPAVQLLAISTSSAETRLIAFFTHPPVSMVQAPLGSVKQESWAACPPALYTVLLVALFRQMLKFDFSRSAISVKTESELQQTDKLGTKFSAGRALCPLGAIALSKRTPALQKPCHCSAIPKTCGDDIRLREGQLRADTWMHMETLCFCGAP